MYPFFIIVLLVTITSLSLSGHAKTSKTSFDCCYDLEHRIAELEKTTVRKSPTKMSLKISGWMNMGLMFWDDGQDSDAYVVDNTELNSRFRFTGIAKFAPGWTAGYRYEVGLSSLAPRGDGIPGSDKVDQLFINGDDQGPNLRIADIWIQNKTLGRITAGFGNPPSWFVKNWAGRISGTNFVADSSPQAGMSFFLRNSEGQLTSARWRQFINGRVGPRIERIQWSSPQYKGFQLQAGFGENNWADVALYYNSSFQGSKFKDYRVMGALTYRFTDDPNFPAGGPAPFYELKGSLGAFHKPTGLYAWGASATRDWDDPILDGGYDWYVQSGIKRKMNSLGATAFYADYADHTNIRTGFSAASLGFTDATVGDTHGNYIGIGVVQWIDSAAMELFAAYRHYEMDQLEILDSQGAEISDLDVEDFQTLFIGTRVKF